MAAPLNLSQYGRDLDDAYRKVLDPKSSIDWVLTGYLGRDTLRVSKMGCGLAGKAGCGQRPCPAN